MIMASLGKIKLSASILGLGSGLGSGLVKVRATGKDEG